MSGVANMAAGISSIARLRTAIKDLPIRIRSAVAKDAEAVLTTLVRESFDAGRTAYGTARPAGTNGQALTLRKTGATRSDLGFVAVGTIVRAVLGRNYQRFLVGKYAVLPQSLPAAWSKELGQIVREYAEDFQREALR